MTDDGQTRWGLVLALWAAGLGAAAQYGKISVIFDRLDALYPGAGGALGFAVSLVGVLGILLGVVAGVVVAGIGYRRTITGALWIGAGMSALQALHLPFAAFLLSRVVEGISHLGLVVAIPTLIAQVSAERHRGLTLTLWGTFFGVAFALLAWFGLPLVARYGVLSLFWAHAAVMALLALGLRAALRDVPVPARSPLPPLRDMAALHLGIYRSPRISAPAAGWVFYTMCFVSILTVLPPYIDPAQRAFVMGAMPLASIAVSLTLGVALLRWITAVQVVMLGFVVSALCMFWLWLDPGDALACLVLAGALGLVQGASFAAVPQLNATAQDRARANGAMAQAGNLGNTLGTPLMVLVLVQAGYGGLTWVTLALLLCGAGAHLLLAARRSALPPG
ncbi:MAG: MFS transporter [Marinibacterium sp.]|nr:MFS transporter [Marinibacterium sp.]